MRYLFSILLFSISLSVFTQDLKPEITEGVFFKLSIAGTLTTNEDIDLSDEYNDNIFEFNALFFNAGVGYQFDPRASIGINFEYANHRREGLLFFPAYINFRYNIIKNDDNVFLRGGYGKLLNIDRSFESGNLYKLGAGYQIFDGDYRNSFLIGIDFTRKRFGFRQLDAISSVSVFLEFQFF